MMNRIDAIGNQPQITFRAKPGNRKQIHEFIDKSSNLAMEILNKDRPLSEKRETLFRDTLLKLKIKCPFLGKVVKPNEVKIEHIKSENNKIIQMVDDAHMQAYLTELKQKDPEMYKEVLKREAEHKVAQMTNMQIIKEFIKSFFTKK